MINRKIKFVWGILAFLLFIGVLGCVTMLLWNALIPVILGGILINYWQALGILVLARLLFGGFGLHHFHNRFHQCHPHHGYGPDHLHKMSRDEKREFIRRQVARNWCCDEPVKPEPETEETQK